MCERVRYVYIDVCGGCMRVSTRACTILYGARMYVYVYIC